MSHGLFGRAAPPPGCVGAPPHFNLLECDLHLLRILHLFSIYPMSAPAPPAALAKSPALLMFAKPRPLAIANVALPRVNS